MKFIQRNTQIKTITLQKPVEKLRSDLISTFLPLLAQNQTGCLKLNFPSYQFCIRKLAANAFCETFKRLYLNGSCATALVSCRFTMQKNLERFYLLTTLSARANNSPNCPYDEVSTIRFAVKSVVR